jgi:hypothetical protein
LPIASVLPGHALNALKRPVEPFVTQRFVSGGGKSVVLDGVSPGSELYNLILSFMGAF